MPASISFRQLDDDGPAVLERLAAHPEGIVVTFEGCDVARIVPLSAEERAWRDALLSEGVDPEPDRPYDPDPIEALIPIAFPIKSDHTVA